MNPEALEARLHRLESVEEIRQLVAKYALSLDMRDLDAHVGLFAPDIRVGAGAVGRAALRDWLDDTLRNQFTGTAHVTGNHIIEFDGADRAHGIVYSRNEHETGDSWVMMTMLYWDDYERIDQRWLFRRRLPCYWYASDLNQPPIGSNKMRWPDRDAYDGAFHDLFPSWAAFWSDGDRSGLAEVAEPAELGEFLTAMRRDAPDPRIRVR